MTWLDYAHLSLVVAGLVLPLAIVLLTPAKPTADEKRIRRLMPLLWIATIVALVIVLPCAFMWPHLGALSFWLFLPLWLGLGMPLILAKRPPARLDTCPACNYSLAGLEITGILRCPECGMTSRPNQFYPCRTLCREPGKK